MAGHFEVFTDNGGTCRVRLVDQFGKELAVSAPFGDKDAAARGIYALREIAASGLIEDHTC
ncbi:hypothetical protein OOZ51_14385 [Arthrobacter sp. MI7-26]|uniref:YegP family protein n=1 Tax=Arthrobacter sp. MI7-26 TaxID=2993653 RepID=UPI0022494B90|nr:hypothetical protein [Arthrobacter sp. MI7-26]MCX2748993.1 hypothetical protein [Arthrobacter sp. MI7-26]